MKPSKEVLRDLLPVYLAGEASADTRALVENALAEDADLRAEASSIGAVPPIQLAPPSTVGLCWIPVYWIGRRLHQLSGATESDVQSLMTLARDPDA